ncbi:MAG: ROK family protein [Actinomycetota bacterium]
MSSGATSPPTGDQPVATTTLAVDLGGTHLRAAVVAGDGTVLSRRRRTTPTDAPVPDAVPELVVELLEAWTGDAPVGDGPAGAPEPPGRAVVGLPGIIDHEREALVHAANLPPAWTDHLNEGWLAERIGCPVSLANDADLAAVGESSFGAGRDHRDVVFVTISTGVGAGLVVDDRLVRGALSGGELGHTVIDRVAAVAGRPATVEDLGSGTAIGRRAAEAGLTERGPALAELVRSGDEAAAEIWRSAIEAVAIGLANLAWTVTPGIVVVGGGVGMNGDLVLPIIRDGLRRFGPAEVPEIEVANAALGDDAALVGAANWWKAVGRD